MPRLYATTANWLDGREEIRGWTLDALAAQIGTEDQVLEAGTVSLLGFGRRCPNDGVLSALIEAREVRL